MYKGIGVLFLAVCALIFVGVIGNYHTSQKPFAVPKTQRFKAKDYREGISNKLIDNVNSENIKKNLRTLTEEPHPAGTKANLRVAEKIAQIWKENGLEDVHFVKYDVLLSYPNYSSPNYMTIYNEADNSTVYRSEGVTPVVIPEEQGAKGAGVQWVAYSASGVVEGDVVYCHYGNEEDFRRLESLGISVRGKIALLRYGYEFRGDKVNHAQLNGAIGAILYSDPGEAAREGTNPERVYPKTEWMPGQAVQRGSIMHLDGDPLSPLYPSRSDMYHSRTVEEARKDHVLPSIPVIPLGYHDAYQILSRLSGRPAPHEWSGGLNVTYNLGPGFSHHNEKLRIEVNGEFDKREIQNVVGYIRGADDPDHYVILGNHFDAWVYGSVDPNSGTAILAEVGRAMVQTMKETDWRPARTIMFCNWDAEEYGLIGSTEFVEDFSNILSDRAVAYLNVDLISANQTLRATAVPSMYNALVDAAKRVPNPMREQREQGLHTVYDQWYKSFPGSHPVYKDFPNIPPPNGGSDHVPFFSYLAIPVVDFTYSNASTDQYPLYHTLYETPFFNEHIFDHDNFSVHRGVAQYWAELARSFADPAILPLNMSIFAYTTADVYITQLKNTISTPLKRLMPSTSDARQQLGYLTRKAQEFVKVANTFDVEVHETERQLMANPYDLRRVHSVNQRIMAVDRCFINPRGLPGEPQKRHVLFSTSQHDSYAARVMASIYDQMDSVTEAKTQSDRDAAARELANQLSIVQYSIQCAINTLGKAI